MNKNVDERQQKLTYKYGYHAYFILMVEVLFMSIAYDICEKIGIEQKILDFGIINWGFLMLILPAAYTLIRGIMSGCEKEGDKSVLYHAPILTILCLGLDWNILLKLLFIIISWIAFFIKIYQIKNYKDE